MCLLKTLISALHVASNSKGTKLIDFVGSVPITISNKTTFSGPSIGRI